MIFANHSAQNQVEHQALEGRKIQNEEVRLHRPWRQSAQGLEPEGSSGLEMLFGTAWIESLSMLRLACLYRLGQGRGHQGPNPLPSSLANI